MLQSFGFVGANAPASFPCTFPATTPVTESILEGSSAAPLVQAARFDGTNDHYEIAAPGPAGVADGTGFTWSRWVKMEGGDGALQSLLWVGTGAAHGLKIERLADNKIQAQWRTAAGVVIGTVVSTSTVTVASGWTHVMLDISGTSAVLRINFSDESNNTPGTAGDIDLTNKWTIARSDDSLNRNYFNGCMAEEWAADASLGLGDDDKAEQFYDSTLGRPRLLGTGGAGPSADVVVYLNQAFGSFHINLAGTDFTLTGAVDDCAGPGNYSPQHVPSAVFLNPINFDAAGDFLSSGGHGTSTDDMTLAFWFRRTTTGVQDILTSNFAGRWIVGFDASDRLFCMWADNSGGPQLRSRTVAGITDTNWHHVMAAWHNTASTGGAATMEHFLDGADVTNIIGNTIGANQFVPQGRGWDISISSVEIELAQLWADNIKYDLTVLANRQKFYNGGKVDLGADGSNPGAQPIVFINNPVASLGANLGSSGVNFTVNGDPTDAATSP
ncbi:MAG: LamG domain-containing protein [Alphaproteobacteria bacterium]|nr:LamG domain-containing protein [Alphaproteobacteria bacterium]